MSLLMKREMWLKSKTQLVDNLTVVFMENQAFDECVKQNGAKWEI